MEPGAVPETLYCGECGRPTASDELARFGEIRVCPACKNNYAQKLREGVEEPRRARYAGFWIRFVASIIDGIITNLVSGIVQFALVGSFAGNLQRLPEGTTPELALLAVSGLAIAVSLSLSAIYEAVFVNRLGATPGKLALGLKVVRPDGGPISLGRAFGRYFAKVLSAIILLIGYIIAGFDSQKRALHDMICDTRVIRARDI